MIVKSGQADAFVRSLDPKLRAVLFYGPNAGLVSERAQAALYALGADLTDPFAAIEFGADAILADRTRLADEAAAWTPTGAERIIRITRATDALGAVLSAWLDGGPAAGRAIIEAGELTKSSSLRKACEQAKNAAAVPCYADDGEAVERFVRATITEAGKSISGEALDVLSRYLSPDRAQSRRELEKLLLFAGEQADIELNDVLACIGDNAAASMDAVIYAAFGGDLRALDQSIERVFADGGQPVSIVRAAARHLQRLLQANDLVHQGRSAEQAMSALRPPVFAMLRQRFRHQLRLWPAERLAPALHMMLETELQCKTTGLPAHALCHRALMRLGRAAASERR